MILHKRGSQKRGLLKMAVHPCTARQCPPQNGVLGQELANDRPAVTTVSICSALATLPLAIAATVARRELRQLSIALITGAFAATAAAEIYIYQGPGGERLVSDMPMHDPGSRLVSQRNSLRYAGRLARDGAPAPVSRDQFQHLIQGAARKFNVDPI
jgi:hypothetical protein